MTKLGAIFPQTEIGNDTGAIREYAQATESLGFDFLLAFDHVLGANAETHTDLTGPYRHYDAFHEPFVLFGYLAAVTSRVELATGIIILPQRQTALVAKQAAAVGRSQRGPPAARHRRRLEPCRIRGAKRELGQPWRALRGAD